MFQQSFGTDCSDCGFRCPVITPHPTPFTILPTPFTQHPASSSSASSSDEEDSGSTAGIVVGVGMQLWMREMRMGRCVTETLYLSVLGAIIVFGVILYKCKTGQDPNSTGKEKTQ